MAKKNVKATNMSKMAGRQAARQAQARSRKASAPPAKAARQVPKPTKPAPAAVASKKRTSWLDDDGLRPVIDRYARQLGSFLDAMADGEVDAAEIKAQEARLVKLMKQIEPMLDDALHAKVTTLLCELAAYDIMQLLHSMQQARPMTAFRG